MNTSEIRPACTFVISSRIGLVTADPYVRAALRRGTDVWVCAPSSLLSTVTERFALPDDRLLGLDALARQRRRLKQIHTGMVLMLASPKLTRSHLLLNDPRSVATTRLGTVLRRIARYTARLHPRRLNSSITAVLCRLHRNPFPTRTVIAISFCSEPALLTARGMDVTTIIESWDHPMKKPAGYTTSAVVGWNDDINRDWQTLQGARRLIVGYPVKLAYALEAGERPMDDSDGRPQRAMYAVGTSSNTDRTEHFAGELEVIEAVCAATAASGWELLIKPKPNGKSGDFDHFADRHPHVSIGAYRDVASALDYDLDDDYNEVRRAELDACDLVINCWTTFGLDAAAAGKPVLQLDLREFHQWPAVAKGSGNYHLTHYLVGLEDAFRPDPVNGLCAALTDELADPFPRARRFTDVARAWVTPSRPPDEIVERVIDLVLSPEGR